MSQHPASEVTRIVERMMAPPVLQPADGFTARVLVPPGSLYDPLSLRRSGGTVMVNDDGGQEGDMGSQIVAIAPDGTITPVAPLGSILPTTGFDIAGASFGAYEGQIFGIAQPAVGMAGAVDNHVIIRFDPKVDKQGSVFCTLPPVADVRAGIGVDACFGPEGSPFAGRLFSIAAQSKTVYQTTADAKSEPFVTLGKGRWPNAAGSISFTPDGAQMLLSTSIDGNGTVARVGPDGTVHDEPLLRLEGHVVGFVAFAPDGFGSYGGQVFVSGGGAGKEPYRQTYAPPGNGAVYRITPEGRPALVVSGLRSPHGLLFVDGRLWVADVGGDFIAGGRELPDGCLVEVGLA